MNDRSALLKDISEMVAAGVADDLSSDEIAGNVMVIVDTAELLANSRPVVVPAQRERPAFLNSLKKTAKVMRSAHDKGGDRLMSIWTEDVQGVEEAIEFLEGCATTEESRG